MRETKYIWYFYPPCLATQEVPFDFTEIVTNSKLMKRNTFPNQPMKSIEAKSSEGFKDIYINNMAIQS